MALYLKRLVSGQKTRFRDDELDVELDLAYVTDEIIVMGFPAVGVEGIYRNHRADVQRFLSARHGSDFWVFNFCPLRENAYHERVFDGRVSRYPFPDHHVPPLLYLPLVTREIHGWLSGSDARVAVLHCKAGKGRSGTMACAYLLSRYPSPSLPDNFSQWSLIDADDKEGLQTPSTDTSKALPTTFDRPVSVSRVSSEPMPDPLEKVLDLHTSRRMKSSLQTARHPNVPLAKKPKMGISIPSQRRWLYYWSQILDGKGPSSLRLSPGKDHPEDETLTKIPKVKLTKITVRMREPSGIQPHLVQAASVIITSAGKGRAINESTAGKLWVSLARYSDRLVNELERWEKESRSTCVIRPSPFGTDRWDKSKMIRSFAQMVVSDTTPIRETESSPVLSYVLRPLHGTEEDTVAPVPEPNHEPCRLTSESSYVSVSSPTEGHASEDQSGILLDANRELRIRLFMGEVVLGWVWLIPAFHMSSDSQSSSVVFSGDDIDFAIGIGKALVDIKISFAWDSCVKDP